MDLSTIKYLPIDREAELENALYDLQDAPRGYSREVEVKCGCISDIEHHRGDEGGDWSERVWVHTCEDHE